MWGNIVISEGSATCWPSCQSTPSAVEGRPQLQTSHPQPVEPGIPSRHQRPRPEERPQPHGRCPRLRLHRPPERLTALEPWRHWIPNLISKKKPPPKAGAPKTLLGSVTLFPPREAFFPHERKVTRQLALCQSRLSSLGLLPIAWSERLDPFAGALHFAFSRPTDYPLVGQFI